MNSTDLNDEVKNTNSMKIKCWSLCWWELFSKVYVETLHKLNFLWLTCVNPWVWSSWPKKCIFMPSLKALQVFFESLLFKSVFLKWIVMSLWPGMMVAWKLKVLWIQFLQPTWVMIWQVFWETRIVNQKIHIHIYNIHIHLHICICIYTYHILWFTLW